jgi:hypothetical protein
MKRTFPPVDFRAATLLVMTCVGLLFCNVTAAADPPSVAPAPVVARHPGGLNLLLTQSELRDWVQSYETKTGQDLTSPIEHEEVLVRAPGMIAPMRDVSQDAWGGIAAPFWAIANPKNAWRILVPIPPRDSDPASERPAPDPR